MNGAIGVQRTLARFCARIGNVVLLVLTRLLFQWSAEEPSRILVFRTGGIGDFVCALPAIAYIRRKFPRAAISLLTTPSGNPANFDRNMLAGATALDENVVSDVFLFYGSELRSVSKMLGLRRAVMRSRPQLCFVIPQTGERFSGMLRKLVFLGLLGVTAPVRGWRLMKPLSVFPHAQFLDGGFDHQVRTALKAVGAGENETVVFPLVSSPSARDRIGRIFQENGLDTGDVVAVFLGGQLEHRRWPVEKYVELCRRLLSAFDISIVIIGGPDDTAVAEELAQRVGYTAVNLAGRTSLAETVEILRRSRLYIGNDSGPAHLAAAAGVPCVSIFASVNFPGIWDPWGEDNIAIRHAVPCQYCLSEGHCPMRTSECITSIAVDEVLEAAASQLARFGLGQRPLPGSYARPGGDPGRDVPFRGKSSACFGFNPSAPDTTGC
jgi:heptosyltransferase-2